MSHPTNENKKIDRTVVITMMSGLFAGSIAKFFTHPLDTIKAKIQVNSSVTNKARILDTFTHTLKTEGLKGLYRGLPVSVFGSMPASVLYFGSYEFAKKRLLLFKNFSHGEFLMYFLGGMFAETVSCIIFVPVDVIKERRQVQVNLKTFAYKNDFDALKTILKQERLRGLYKAYGATVMSFGPMSAFYFMFYEYFKGFFVRNDAKTYLQRVNKEEIEKLKEMKLDISFTQSLFASAMASALSSFITNPLDLVKLRMQVQRASDVHKPDQATYRNLLHGLGVIFKAEGLGGLYKGSMARTLYFTPTGALTMSILEFTKPIVRKLINEDI
jgi:hypothetical protein